MLRDAGDLAAWERGYRFAQYAKLLNENPRHLLDVIQNLRFNVSCVTCHKPGNCMLIKVSRWRQTILEAVELQVSYIGLQSVRTLLPLSGQQILS